MNFRSFFQLLFSGVYVVTVYYLTSQPMELQRMSQFVIICVLTSLVSQSLGLLIGAGLSVESGVFIGPVASIPTVLFSGFFVTFDTIPGYLKWLTYVSYVRYGFEGMSPNQNLILKTGHFSLTFGFHFQVRFWPFTKIANVSSVHKCIAIIVIQRKFSICCT